MPEEKILDQGLAIIGDEDVVLGFKALGFKAYPVKEPQEASAALSEVAQRKDAVCLVQEDIYLASHEQINSYKDLPLPVFLSFSKDASMPLLERMVKDIRLRATGTL